jgi:hypothetical protein
MLNQFSGASLGLSLDKLDKNYTGSAIKVRRSSDNNELDIGFVNNELDTASLLDFVNTPVVKFQSDFVSGDSVLSTINVNTVENQSIGGEDEALKVTLTGGDAFHYIKNNGVVEVGKNFNFTFDVYIPSSNSVVNQIYPNRPFDSGYLSPSLDTWVSYTFTGISEYDDIQIFAAEGDSINVNADGDVFYIKNIVVTQINADGFVPTIYDQVGSNNMTQTTANLQGQIVSNGSVILKGGKPCIIRSVDNSGGYLSTYAPNEGVAVKGVFYVGDNEGKTSIMFGSNTHFNDVFVFAKEGDNSSAVGGEVTISLSKINGSTITMATRNEAFISTNKHFLLYREADFNFQNNLLGLGYRNNSPVNLGMFTFQELVIFENTDDAVAKENNINSRYNIY